MQSYLCSLISRYEHWSNIGADSNVSSKHSTVGKILTVLDRFSFDSSTKDNCMDVLHKKVWGELPSNTGAGVSVEDEAVVMILCQWAVTNKRSGDHRAFVAAKLLEQWQSDLVAGAGAGDNTEEKEEEVFYPGPPVFQQLLLSFLNTETPHFTSALSLTNQKTKTEIAAPGLLFHELMSHKVNVLHLNRQVSTLLSDVRVSVDTNRVVPPPGVLPPVFSDIPR